MNNEYNEVCTIPHDHPSLVGHFPGAPIVPGVVLMDCVVKLVQQRQPWLRVAGLKRVKFLAPIHPDVQFSILLVQNKPDRIKFECFVDGLTVTTGVLLTEPAT